MSEKLQTFAQFARENPAFTEGSLRWLRFCSKPGRKNSQGEAIEPNGFDDAFAEVGGRVYIKPDRFFELAESSRGGKAA